MMWWVGAGVYLLLGAIGAASVDRLGNWGDPRPVTLKRIWLFLVITVLWAPGLSIIWALNVFNKLWG